VVTVFSRIVQQHQYFTYFLYLLYFLSFSFFLHLWEDLWPGCNLLKLTWAPPFKDMRVRKCIYFLGELSLYIAVLMIIVFCIQPLSALIEKLLSEPNDSQSDALVDLWVWPPLHASPMPKALNVWTFTCLSLSVGNCKKVSQV